MAGRQGGSDPDSSVANRLARARGVTTQADVEQARRDLVRIADVGDDPDADYSGAKNFIGGPFTFQGRTWFIFSADGDIIRIGPAYEEGDPLAVENTSSFVFVYSGAGGIDSYFAGYDSLGFLLWKFGLNGGLIEFWQDGAHFKRVDGTEMAVINATTGDITTSGQITATKRINSLLEDRSWLAGFHSDVGLNTVSTVGLPAGPTLTGTLSNTTVSGGPLLTFATTNVSGNVASVVTGAYWRTDWGFDCVFQVRTGTDITNVRLWAALAAADLSGSATPAVQHIGFRFDTGAPDTTWKVHTSDGATTNSLTSGPTVALNATYTLRMTSTDGTSVLFYIDGTLVQTVSTNLPTVSTLLACRISVTTLAAEINNFRLHHFKILSK